MTPSQRSRDVKGETLSRFHLAFALMSVIPLLIAFYLVTVRFFSIDILVGLNGVYFLAALTCALLGLLVGRHIIKNIIQQLVEANQRTDTVVADLASTNEQLSAELIERKRAEEQLRKANTELGIRERTLRELIQELKRSGEELKVTQLSLMHADKLKSVGRLAAGVAHEVKNPLAILLIGINYLSSRMKTNDEQVSGTLQDMEEAIRRADAVIRGMLDFSASKGLIVQNEDLNEIAERTLLLVKHALDEQHITVVRLLGTDLPKLKLDHQKIQQAFLNIFMNAIDAMPQGGVLTVKTYADQLSSVGGHVGYRANDRFKLGQRVVVAEVDDTGIGIPKELCTKIFDPFFTTKPAGQGTGLGLAVTQNIVDLHGGTIDIRNRDDNGVRVTITMQA